MKLNRNYQYIILCEDVQMRTFILSFLDEQDIKPQKIRVRSIPCGEGCGEAYVRRELPKEVKILHATSYLKQVLVVCVDADNHTVDERVKMLIREVEDDKKKWSRTNEPIVFWIPKRQIETWIHFFKWEAVDENNVFPHSGKRPESCKNVANIFSEYCQGTREMDCSKVPSLIAAKDEYERVCRLQR